MKKLLLFGGAVLMVIFLFSCGVNLEQDEARKIITEHFGFPKPVMTRIYGEYDSDIGKGIRKIISNGYVYHNPKASGGSVSAALAPDYLPTEKGKEYIRQIDFNGFYKEFTYYGAVVKECLKSIDEILIDKESKVATIKYTTKFEPIEPFYSAICVNRRCPFFGENLHRENREKIKLKKYDKGWRVPE